MIIQTLKRTVVADKSVAYFCQIVCSIVAGLVLMFGIRRLAGLDIDEAQLYPAMTGTLFLAGFFVILDFFVVRGVERSTDARLCENEFFDHPTSLLIKSKSLTVKIRLLQNLLEIVFKHAIAGAVGISVAGHAASQQRFSSLSHNPYMKRFYIVVFVLLASLAVLPGCASSRVARTDAPDGFYIGTDTAFGSYLVRGFYPSDSPHALHIHEISTFQPEHIVITASLQRSDWFDLAIAGRATEGLPDTYNGIIVIAKHKAYFGISKRTGSSGTVKVLFETRKEADTVVSALRTRYSLPP